MVIKGKFVFVHIPKTGGNNFQSQIFDPSAHAMELSGNQDGKDRFDVKDEFTSKKHQTLSGYLQHPELADYEFVSVVRHPVTRMFSRYFSPSHNVQPKSSVHAVLQKLNDKLPKAIRLDANIFSHYVKPVFDREDFLVLMRKSASQSDFLTKDGKLHSKLTIIHFENYDAEVSEFLSRHGFEYTLTHVNKGKHKPDYRNLLDAELIAEFRDGPHGEDLKNFGYDLSEFEVAA